MKTADRIRKYQKKGSLSLSDVADRAGMSLDTLKHIYYGHNLCGIASAKKLAPVLNSKWHLLAGN